MATIINWTHQASLEFQSILEYWAEKNQTNTYSKKLAKHIMKSIQTIKKYPKIGKATDMKEIRVIISGNYSIFYEVKESNIYILSIWDNRRNPDTLKLK